MHQKSYQANTMQITDEMLKRAIEAYAKDTGAEDWQLEGWIEPAIRAALEAALSAAEPVKPYGYVVELVGVHEGKEIYVYRSRCQPRLAVAEACVAHWSTIYDNSRWRFKIVPLFAAAPSLSAQVQDDSEIVDCLLAGKPFVFDPATNFCHADDGGAPEHGIKYVPAAQVQDVARDLPSEFEKWWDDAGHYVGGVVKMTYTQRKQLAWDAFYASANPAAPAKQEGK